jgi:uncharacterized small protein (DUF1192 family)
MKDTPAPSSGANSSALTPTTHSLLFEAVTDLYEQVALLTEEIAALKAEA